MEEACTHKVALEVEDMCVSAGQCGFMMAQAARICMVQSAYFDQDNRVLVDLTITEELLFLAKEGGIARFVKRAAVSEQGSLRAIQNPQEYPAVSCARRR